MQPAKSHAMEGSQEFTIDLEKIIASKNPVLLKFIPGFVLNYLRRIIHVDEINDFLRRNRDKHGLDFVKAVLDEMEAIVTSEGQENIPREERFIVAANHPLGGLDGLALIHVIGKVRKDVIFPVNDLLMNIPNLRELFVPINKHGSNAENVKILENTFASDSTLLYFPAGLCSRKRGDTIIDLEWKKTFITKAKRHKRDILPVHISGRNSGFFYNLANIRKRLGLKANIEMLYLPDEMYKQKNKSIHVRIGKPVSYTVFDRKYPDKVWAEKIKSHVYKLGTQTEPAFEA